MCVESRECYNTRLSELKGHVHMHGGKKGMLTDYEYQAAKL